MSAALHLALSPEQEEDVQKIIASQKVERRLWLRASIISRLSQGGSVAATASDLGVTPKTVRKWAQRFIAGGLPGLEDQPRSGRPPIFSVEQRCDVIAIACDEPKHYGFEGDTHWCLSTLTHAVQAKVDGPPMSRTSVWRTLQAGRLKPHRTRMWLHSPDLHFKEKVNTIVGLYLHPPKDAVVLCVDEKTGMQATERKYPTQRPVPGRPGRYEYEYIRHGTQSLFAAFNIRTGHVTAACGPTRKANDLVDFMETVAVQYAGAKRVMVIWDNLNIHFDGPDERWTKFNDRHGKTFEFIYTPKHASWVNQVEIFFSILHRRVLKRGDFTSQDDLRAKVLAFIHRWNDREGHPFRWTFRGYPMQEEAA